ncbi:MAG: T9SS type A sorting domain-containing protein [Flavobacteriales bacterium]|nr:T9SS type A sorting domain-containing protein [Flavobacteriales bacterium]
MNKLFTMAFLSIAALPALPQTPDWLWAQSCGSSLGRANAVGASSDGAIVAGDMAGTGSFGGLVLPGSEFSAFVGKAGPTGDWAWVTRTVGGWGSATSVDVDPADGVLVGGTFQNTVTFGTATLQFVPDENEPANKNGFVARLDASGEWMWAFPLHATRESRVRQVRFTSAGTALACGAFSDTLLIGDTMLVSNGGLDAFLVELDADGELLRAWHAGSSLADEAMCVSEDQNGHVLIGGSHSSNFTIGNTTYVGANDHQGFAAALDGNSEVLWSRHFGDDQQVICNDVAVLADGRNVFSGLYYDAALVVEEDTLPVAPSLGSFLACFDGTGSLEWTASITGPSLNQVSRVEPLGNGVLAFGQVFASSLVINGNQVQGAVSGGPPAAFAFDAQGDLSWTLIGNGPGMGFWDDASVATNGAIYFTGLVNGDIQLGTNLVSASSSRALVARTTLLSTAVQEMTSAALQVTPQPASDQVRISGLPNGPVQVRIHAADGTLVRLGTLTAEPFDVSDLPSGVYVVHAAAGGTVLCTRLVVAR